MSKKVLFSLAVILSSFLFSSVSYAVEPEALVLSNVSINPASSFDPSNSGLNQSLQITYSCLPTPENVSAKIMDSRNVEIRTLNASNGQLLPAFDGEYAGKILEPGTYKVSLTATKAGSASDTAESFFTVSYSNTEKPGFAYFNLSTTSFDPDFGDISFDFSNTKESEITVKILDLNRDIIKTFSSYSDDSFSGAQTHQVVWDGKNDSTYAVNTSTYIAKIILRNAYGVTVEERQFSVTDIGTFPASNAHISDISLRPSTFNPDDDEEIRIIFDIDQDIDELQVVAVRGNDEIEIFEESNLEKETNYEINWDGTDDDEFLSEGNWRIEFRSTLDSNSLICGRTILFEYEKPVIDDLYLSKSTFDNDIGEFTYVIFRVDADSMVDVDVLLDGDEDDNITEEMEVEKDSWYAVSWDGGSYDYDEDISIRVKAYNRANEDVYNTRTIRVDLAEEKTSSSKSNVTADFIDPVISDGSDKLNLFYNIEDDADVTITFYKGTSSSGTKIDELLSINDQSSGDHSISFDAVTSSGSRLSKGVYNYKIVSKLSSSDTETGVFVIGTVGEYDSASSSNTGTSSTKISPNVIIDGVSSSNNVSSSGNCGGFNDVYSSSRYCDAIEWAKNEGIFQGYADGSFKPNNTINRVELLKTAIEANRLITANDDSGNAGFSDVSSGAWYVRYIKSGLLYGIFSGDAGKNTARPGDFVNRAEALKIAFEAKRVSSGYNISQCSGSSYDDVPYNSWYAKYACESKNLGLFDAYLNNFYPGNLATRGEMAYVLYMLR